MRKSRRTLNELVVELSQAPTRPNICARCNFVFNYPDGAPWSEAFSLVCEHWKTCLADISGDTVPPPSGDATRTDRENLSVVVERETTPLPNKRKRSASQSPAGSSRIRKKNVMDRGTRRQLIERDVLARNATAKSVECKGCGRTIKLDKRSDYYPGLWHKHRNKCPAIRRMAGTGNKKTEDAGMTVTRRRPQSPSKVEYISSPTENLATRREAHDRIPRWAASSGLRYHTVSSHTTGNLSRSTSPMDRTGWHTANTRAGALQRISTQKQDARNEISREDADFSELNDTENSDDEDYWDGTPFGPDKESVDSSDSAPGRDLYRYSTRRELLTRYRNGASQGRELNDSCSEEVMQAARFLVSMKSRISV